MQGRFKVFVVALAGQEHQGFNLDEVWFELIKHLACPCSAGGDAHTVQRQFVGWDHSLWVHEAILSGEDEPRLARLLQVGPRLDEPRRGVEVLPFPLPDASS